jgi:hypothetical protein
MTKQNSDSPEKKVKLWTRAACGVGGVGFLILAAVDATMDPFPGLETYFASTAITLLGIAAWGRQGR